MAEASRRFRLSYRTVERWCKRQREEGTVSARVVGKKPGKGKINKERLQADVDAYPDATLKARGERFGVSDVAVLRALQRMRITYKKNTALRRA
jgi:transposase